MVPFQKGPCGEGGRMRGFLLPLLEEVAVVVPRSFFTHFFFEFSPFSHSTKVNRIKVYKISKREEKLWILLRMEGE